MLIVNLWETEVGRQSAVHSSVIRVVMDSFLRQFYHPSFALSLQSAKSIVVIIFILLDHRKQCCSSLSEINIRYSFDYAPLFCCDGVLVVSQSFHCSRLSCFQKWRRYGHLLIRLIRSCNIWPISIHFYITLSSFIGSQWLLHIWSSWFTTFEVSKGRIL